MPGFRFPPCPSSGALRVPAARLLVPLAIAAGCAPAEEDRSRPAEPERVKARLVSERSGWTPGAVQSIGLLLIVAPEWHLYGNLRSDTGLPLEIYPDPPEGFSVVSIGWPAPERLVSPGGILDHVYDRETLLILDVKVPAELPSGKTIAFPCSVAWLVCGTGCVPGSARPILEMPVLPPSADAPLTAEAERFRSARERIPRPLEAAGRAIRVEAGPEAAVLEVPGAAGLAFLPGEECVPFEDPIRDAVSETGRLRLRYASGFAPPARIAGLLEIRDAGGPIYYSIDLLSSGRGAEEARTETGGLR